MEKQIKTTVKTDGFEGILFPGNHTKDMIAHGMKLIGTEILPMLVMS